MRPSSFDFVNRPPKDDERTGKYESVNEMTNFWLSSLTLCSKQSSLLLLGWGLFASVWGFQKSLVALKAYVVKMRDSHRRKNKQQAL